ncbi:MAG: hypothetical protein KIT69_06090 [Propionibacteriaceae bacterium]|nr:hypothetical protein [Propionibacteriaceae bacterium]
MAKRSRPETKPEPQTKRKAKGSGLVIAGVPRVNLLPPSEVQRRAAGALVRRWAAGLVATAIVVSGLVAAAYWERGIVDQQLAAEQARTLDLNVELAGLSHVSRAFAERTTLTTLRSDAMGTDIEWRPLLADLAGSLPKGAELTGLELITGANPVADAEPGTGIGAIGRLTVGTDDPADQNRMVDKLRALDIVLAADAGALTSTGEDGFSFVVEFVLDQTHYSGDHLPEAGAR